MSLLDNLYTRYRAQIGAHLYSLTEFRGETTWLVDRVALHDLLKDLKQKDGFNFLVDITSVDHFGEDPRFELVYELCRLTDALYLRVKVKIGEEKQECWMPTVTDLWKTADWHEREVYDMMGIFFKGHPDLRRILMWDGYPYFPLRKDFPLEGKPTEMPDIAFSDRAPMEGGPFVAPAANLTLDREPRARSSF